jgi:hypothetical protein
VKRTKVIRYTCNVVAALLLGGAGAYLLFGADKGLGIFLVLGAAVTCRVLVISIPEALDSRR